VTTLPTAVSGISRWPPRPPWSSYWAGCPTARQQRPALPARCHSVRLPTHPESICPDTQRVERTARPTSSNVAASAATPAFTGCAASTGRCICAARQLMRERRDGLAATRAETAGENAIQDIILSASSKIADVEVSGAKRMSRSSNAAGIELHADPLVGLQCWA